jgi:glutathione S-transferase
VKVHRALRALKLPHERRAGSMPAAWKRYNPSAQVPVLLVDDRPVADSTEILRELGRITQRDLGGNSPAERAESWLYEELADTAVNGFLVASRWADDRNWPTTRARYFDGMPALLQAIIPAHLRRGILSNLVARDVWRAGPDACWSRFTRLLDQLDARAPAKGFWVSEELTAADFALFGQLHRFRTELTPWQRDRVAERPTLSAWLDRVHAATWPHPVLSEQPSCAAPIDSFASSSSSVGPSAAA